MPDDKPPGTIEIGDDFVGLKDADGKVLVDDTAYFQQREAERPIWEALEQSERYRELQGMFDVCLKLLEPDGGEAVKTLRRTQMWLEQYVVSTCATMLGEAKKGV